MKTIFASWRIELIERKKEKGCFFCKYLAENEKNDEKNYIIKRGKHAFIILNAFPYSNGHIMIAPISHKANLEDLTIDEILEIFEFKSQSIKALKDSMNPDGFNIGVNLGLIAGAGVPDHIHWHIVPRWSGDHNFMPILADTRVIPEALEKTYKKLKNKI